MWPADGDAGADDDGGAEASAVAADADDDSCCRSEAAGDAVDQASAAAARASCTWTKGRYATGSRKRGLNAGQKYCKQSDLQSLYTIEIYAKHESIIAMNRKLNEPHSANGNAFPLMVRKHTHTQTYSHTKNTLPYTRHTHPNIANIVNVPARSIYYDLATTMIII